MISRRSILLTFTIAILSGGNLPALARSRRTNPIRMFDTDNDGTLDLAEVKKAASALFARLDRVPTYHFVGSARRASRPKSGRVTNSDTAIFRSFWTSSVKSFNSESLISC